MMRFHTLELTLVSSQVARLRIETTPLPTIRLGDLGPRSELVQAFRAEAASESETRLRKVAYVLSRDAVWSSFEQGYRDYVECRGGKGMSMVTVARE